eukprot:m.144883 g.144883  ORF g.144883 m.144883 type:complete len:61 (+) comp16209_c0_seq8:121-303(+)
MALNAAMLQVFVEGYDASEFYYKSRPSEGEDVKSKVIDQLISSISEDSAFNVRVLAGCHH